MEKLDSSKIRLIDQIWIQKHIPGRFTMRRGTPSRIALHKCWMLGSVILLLASCRVASQIEDETAKQDGQQDDTHGKKIMSLGESIRKSQLRFQGDRANLMQGYWNQTFEEIKDLSLDFQKPDNFLSQWKFLSDTQQEKKTRRFDGFRSWDRMLQEWAEDITDYIEQTQAEGGDYPLSTFGVPSKANDKVENMEQTQVEQPPPETDVQVNGERKAVEQPSSEVIVEVDGELKTVERPTAEIFVGMNGTVSLITSGKKLPTPTPAKPGEPLVADTDISDKTKRIWIVTTASLPWMTGTAVNALLRAAYLTKGRAPGSVTLMLPWLELPEDQVYVYGKDRAFETQADQEKHVKTWLRETAGMKEASERLNIAWYNAQQSRAENSIYSMGDITALIPAEDADIVILEEPEHLNWYRAPGENWTTKFKHVVGIVHTNYFVYAQEQPGALIRAPAMRLLCAWMCRAHCHRIIKLSGTLGKFAPEKELIENVHGVRGTFLDIGEEVRERLLSSQMAAKDDVFGPNAEPSIYFIGKMLWSKGLLSLMELLKYAEESANLQLKVDMYGGGPDKDAAEAKAKKFDLDMPFHGALEHSKLAYSHKIFINPSLSEVLCTTVSEALAMGKFVILPSHPSNDFFVQFPNCLPYSSKEEFVGNLYYALTHSPKPLSEEFAYALSWDAANERLEAAGSISVREQEAMTEAIDAGVEIELPPLIEDDQQRRRISSTIRLSRHRYRQFRSRLSDEIKQSNVLPKKFQERLISELEKRLDVDVDTILESPKLRLQLSPAELDNRLLDFYNGVIKGSSGDYLRLLSGGSRVGMQNLYMKQQAQQQRRRERRPNDDGTPAFSSALLHDEEDDLSEEKDRSAAQWVKLALRRNLPTEKKFVPFKVASKSPNNGGDDTRMSMMSYRPSFASTRMRRKISSPLI